VNQEEALISFTKFFPFCCYLNFVGSIFVADAIFAFPFESDDCSFFSYSDKVRIKLSFFPTLNEERIYFLSIANPELNVI
jgi:hypothetical protein